MLIDTTLFANPEIVRGLSDGTLSRFGGVIRESATGHIVKHLAESPSMTNQMLNGLQGTASSVLGMSQIAAGASILNLGVSIAGFLYMNHKLNQLRNSITYLQASVDEGFNRIDNRLEVLSHQLGYIQLIVQYNRQEQQVLSESVSELHRAVLIQEIANLQAALQDLSRFPDSSPRDALKAT